MKHFFVIIFGVLIIAVAGYVFLPSKSVPLSSAEKQKAMERLLGRRPVLSITPRPTGWVVHQGQYFTGTYPAAARIYADSASPSATLLETFQFQETASPAYFAVVTVRSAGEAKTYDDIADFHVRDIQKTVYAEQKVTITGSDGYVFTKNEDGVEKTAFVLKNGNIYSVAITGSSTNIFPILDRFLTSLTLY